MSTAQTPDITIHHLNNSRSERIFWACEELNIPYNVKVWYRSPVQAPKELKEIHPLGKAPVITDHGKTIAESGAIIDYILHTYSPSSHPPSFSPQDSYFSHYAEGTLMLFLQMGRVIEVAAGQAPWLVKGVCEKFADGVKTGYIDKELVKNFAYLEAELAKSPTGWFGHQAEPSAADFMMLYPLNAVLSNPDRVGGLEIGPKIKNWMKRVKERPAYQKGLARLQEEERKGKASVKGRSRIPKRKSKL